MKTGRFVRGTTVFLMALVLGLTVHPAAGTPENSRRQGPRRPEFDAAAATAPDPAAESRVSRAASGLLQAGRPLHTDGRRGVPTFLWASRAGSDAGLARARALAAGPRGPKAAVLPLRAEEAVRGHLDAYRDLYGLSGEDVAAAEIAEVHDLGRGPIIARLRRTIDGVEVFRDEMRIVMDRRLNLVAISGHMPGGSAVAARGANAFRLSRADAVAIAWSDLSGQSVPAAGVAGLGARPGNYEEFGLVPALAHSYGAMTRPARVKPVWFSDTGLVAAFYVEVDSASDDGSDNYAYVVSAEDGRILFRHDLTAYDEPNAYSYRVWAATPADPANPSAPFDGPQGNLFDPHPDGVLSGIQPPGAVPTNDLTLVSSPYAADPWLPIGAVESAGNNADAYADISGADGYTPATGDYRADITGPNAFLRGYDPANPGTLDSRKAALVQMFYNVNFFHDWYYASGFTEAAGNAQASNYGRGGVEGDSIRAEGQDQSGRNNANMNTPADGGRPRMQMFLFDGIAARHFFATSGGTSDYATGVPSGWGIPAASAYDVTGDLVWVNDGVGSSIYPPATTTTTTIHDGCNYTPGAGGTVDPNWAAVTGKVAFIDRGGAAVAPQTCGFSDKAFNATRAGAIAVVIASTTPHAASSPGNMANTAGSGATTIPAVQLSTPDGDALRNLLGVGTPVTAHLTRAAAVDRDGTIDAQIMAHEWGHYISNRLVANSSGLTTNMARGMGEGWADFHAMLLTVKEEDAAVAGNDQYQGVYGQAVWVETGGPNGPIPNQGVYYGIRRMPYSTDVTKNNMTYKNIQDNSAVPVGVPFAFWPVPGTTAVNGGNSEVHNTGEVWATMLWECYAALLRDTVGASPRLSFAEARDRMKDYLVAAYKLTPPQPTFLEARDAVLAAAYAGGDTRDYNLFLTAFAKRGAGFGAVSPDRYSATNNGVVESFAVAPNLVFAGAAITDDTTTCDTDGSLDTGEAGHLTVRLRNDSEQVLTATSATITAIGPNAANVTFPSGNVVALSPTSTLETASGSIPIALASGLAGVQPIDLKIDFGDPALSALGTQTVNFSRRGNLDEVVGQSFTDDVEESVTGFTQVVLAPPAGGQNLPVGWFRNEIGAYDHNYKAADLNGLSDLALVSPSVTIGADPLSISFRHRYSFEFSGATLFDGGVVEISRDAGNTWADVTSFTGVTVTGQAYTNPLANSTVLGTRRAFGGLSPGYPAYVNTTFNLGTQFAGTAIVVRFRLASDANSRADGWEVDDITLQGAAARPFRALLPNKCNATTLPGQTNRRPTAAIAPQAAVPERSLVTLSGAGSTDADGDALQYFWAQLSGTPVVITQSPASPTMSFTAPDVAPSGSVIMTLTVSDGTAFSTTVTRTVTITNVDRPPVASAGSPQTVDERTIVVLNGSGSSDPDGDALAYAWTQTAGPAVSLQGASTASPLFIAPDVGTGGATLTFQLTVTASGVPAVATVDVNVSNVNRPPTGAAGSNQTVVEGTLVHLLGTANDPDGDGLGFAWTQISPASPSTVLSDAAALQPTFIAPEVAADTAFVFQMSVSDGMAPASTSQVTVTVRNCDHPGQEVVINLVSLDATGHPVLRFQDPNPASAATGYDIYRSAGPNGPWNLLAHDVTDADAGTPDIQYVDGTGNGATTWFYKAAAFNNVCSVQGPW